MSTSASTETDVELSVSERLMTALAGLWRAIQARHGEVPEVVFTLGSGTTGRRRTVKHGHFASSRWAKRDGEQQAEGSVHEVDIGGEGLVRGAEAVLGTVLHEAAHALAEVRGVSETNDGGRYHNLKFATLARELGLDVAGSVGKAGWSDTSVPAATAELYAPQLEVLDAALTVYRVPDRARPAGSAPAGRLLKAQCGCAKPRNIWGARSTFEADDAITCSRCEEPFTLTG